jgi:hypothetical protein
MIVSLVVLEGMAEGALEAALIVGVEVMVD